MHNQTNDKLIKIISNKMQYGNTLEITSSTDYELQVTMLFMGIRILRSWLMNLPDQFQIILEKKLKTLGMHQKITVGTSSLPGSK